MTYAVSLSLHAYMHSKFKLNPTTIQGPILLVSPRPTRDMLTKRTNLKAQRTLWMGVQGHTGTATPAKRLGLPQAPISVWALLIQKTAPPGFLRLNLTLTYYGLGNVNILPSLYVLTLSPVLILTLTLILTTLTLIMTRSVLLALI